MASACAPPCAPRDRKTLALCQQKQRDRTFSIPLSARLCRVAVLAELYWLRNMTQAEVGEALDLHFSVVYRAMGRYGIPARRKGLRPGMPRKAPDR